jgi:uncharacterized membrane protein YkvA (DUF1232 family)
MRDSIVFFRRVLADPRVPRRRKAVLLVLLGYLLSPIDLIPDFIPVIGQLDDLVVAAFALRHLVRGLEPSLVEELWPGDQPPSRIVTGPSLTSSTAIEAPKTPVDTGTPSARSASQKPS